LLLSFKKEVGFGLKARGFKFLILKRGVVIKMFFLRNIVAFFCGMMVVFAVMLSCVFGEIVTAPIDGRPVSLDYLAKLGELNGEEFFAPDKDILDMFPANAGYSRFVESQKVREQIREVVAKADNEDTTVIINTSSYMTAGLVGSRCGDNYLDYQAALEELDELVSLYQKPKYYVNISMPRTLPETRMNDVWRDDKKYHGLGYYYLKCNDGNYEDKSYIELKFSRVTPVQLIMEWSYVTNKRTELGEKSLEQWEVDFIKHFDAVYRWIEPYKSYLSKYIMPFSSVSEIFSKLMKMQEEGKIDEIVVSNDDFQIPDFITYMNGKNAEWIPKENGTPIKFSFARNYITNGPRSIYKLLKDKRGVYQADLAMQGKGENINFIFGTDEIPQLIYARNLSARKNISSDFNVYSTSPEGEVAQFDVLKVNSLVKNDLNFVCAGKNKTLSKIDLYIFDYGNKTVSAGDIIKKMEESKKSGRDVGLVEIYSPDVSASGQNTLFKTLLKNSKEKTGDIGINELACYSAWNTNANAIGLGVAHAQVFGVMKQLSENNADNSDFIKAHLKLLSVHCAEDGFYTVSGKRLLTNERFVPVYEDTLKSDKLLPVIGSDEIVAAFRDKEYFIGGKKYVTKSFDISDYNFPWGRLFECYLGFVCEIRPVQ